MDKLQLYLFNFVIETIVRKWKCPTTAIVGISGPTVFFKFLHIP